MSEDRVIEREEESLELSPFALNRQDPSDKGLET
jgi:hypothetical protein